MMINLTNHQRTTLIWSLALLIGALAMYAQREYGYGLIPAFLLGPSWVLSRHIRAHIERLSLKRLAKRLGKNWVEPEITDGRLIWQFETGGETNFVGMSIVVPGGIDKDKRDTFFDGPPFVMREHDEDSSEPAIAAVPYQSPKMAPSAWAAFKAAMQDALKGGNAHELAPILLTPGPVSPRYDIADLVGVSPVRADFPRRFMYTSDQAYWDFDKPSVERVYLASLIMGCIQAPRFGGQRPCNEDTIFDVVEAGDWRWSVAQHSCLAGWVAWLIAPDDLTFVHECTAHDSHEGLYGDMPSPLKSLCPDYKTAEKAGAAVVRQRLGVPLEMTAQAMVVDGLCLAAEAALVHGHWPLEWAAEEYVAMAKRMQILERAKVLKTMPDHIFAAALLVGFVGPIAFIEDHVQQWETIYQAGKENGIG